MKKNFYLLSLLFCFNSDLVAQTTLEMSDTIQYRYYYCGIYRQKPNDTIECDNFTKNAVVIFKIDSMYAVYNRLNNTIKDDSIPDAFYHGSLKEFSIISARKFKNSIYYKYGKYYYDLSLNTALQTVVRNDSVLYCSDNECKLQGILQSGKELEVQDSPFLIYEHANGKNRPYNGDTMATYDTCKIKYIKQVDIHSNNLRYHCYYFKCKFYWEWPSWYVTKEIDIYVDTITLLPIQTDYIYEDRVTRVAVW